MNLAHYFGAEALKCLSTAFGVKWKVLNTTQKAFLCLCPTSHAPTPPVPLSPAHSPLAQGFSNLVQKVTQGLVETQIPGPTPEILIQQVWSWAWEFAFLVSPAQGDCCCWSVQPTLSNTAPDNWLPSIPQKKLSSEPLPLPGINLSWPSRPCPLSELSMFLRTGSDRPVDADRKSVV